MKVESLFPAASAASPAMSEPPPLPEAAAAEPSPRIEISLRGWIDEEASYLSGARNFERSPGLVARQRYAATHKAFVRKPAPVRPRRRPAARTTLPAVDAIIDRYRGNESSIEETVLEIYQANISPCGAREILTTLWGAEVGFTTIGRLNREIHQRLELWRHQPIGESFPYVFLAATHLGQESGEAARPANVLVAVGLNLAGQRRILGVAPGGGDPAESWRTFLRQLRERGLRDTSLFISDEPADVKAALSEIFPAAAHQYCLMKFKREALARVPPASLLAVRNVIRTIDTVADPAGVRRAGELTVLQLRRLELTAAADAAERLLDDTASYLAFPREHHAGLRTNRWLVKILSDLRQRTRLLGSFSDPESATDLVSARLRHVACLNWRGKRFVGRSERRAA